MRLGLHAPSTRSTAFQPAAGHLFSVMKAVCRPSWGNWEQAASMSLVANTLDRTSPAGHRDEPDQRPSQSIRTVSPWKTGREFARFSMGLSLATPRSYRSQSAYNQSRPCSVFWPSPGGHRGLGGAWRARFLIGGRCQRGPQCGWLPNAATGGSPAQDSAGAGGEDSGHPAWPTRGTNTQPIPVSVWGPLAVLVMVNSDCVPAPTGTTSLPPGVSCS